MTVSWYRIHLNSHQVATNEPAVLKEQFNTLYQRIALHEGVALFASAPLEGGIDFYFSPKCMPDMACLIQYYDGEPCEPPASEHLHLEAGRRAHGQILSSYV